MWKPVNRVLQSHQKKGKFRSHPMVKTKLSYQSLVDILQHTRIKSIEGFVYFAKTELDYFLLGSLDEDDNRIKDGLFDNQFALLNDVYVFGAETFIKEYLPMRLFYKECKKAKASTVGYTLRKYAFVFFLETIIYFADDPTSPEPRNFSLREWIEENIDFGSKDLRTMLPDTFDFYRRESIRKKKRNKHILSGKTNTMNKSKGFNPIRVI